jgi:hypothetical protein
MFGFGVECHVVCSIFEIQADRFIQWISYAREDKIGLFFLIGNAHELVVVGMLPQYGLPIIVPTELLADSRRRRMRKLDEQIPVPVTNDHSLPPLLAEMHV